MTMEHSPHIEFFFSGIKTPFMQGFSMFDYDGGSKHDLWLFILAMRGANLEPYEALVAKQGGSMGRLPAMTRPNFIPPKKKGLGVALGLPQYRRYSVV